MDIMSLYYLTFMALWCGKYENSNSVTCCAADSRGVDENNEDYPSKEVRSNNNVLNLALPRKRVPKVTYTAPFKSDVLRFTVSVFHYLYLLIKVDLFYTHSVCNSVLNGCKILF